MGIGNTKLAEYFPLIKKREEILKEIESSEELKNRYSSWDEKEQEYFLDICTGEKGVKILYDSFFKEIMSPEYTPERISDLLSVLIEKEVRVIEVLPAESRIADEESLLILDMLVKMNDGSLANIEVQKIGYLFAGERAACYSADLLLRQYKRIREQKTRKTFNYKDIKDVYTIVFFEKSPKEFIEFYKEINNEVFIHKSEQQTNTGIKFNLLQKFIFIPLDIFKLIYQNRHIDSKSAAWLTFLSTDQPKQIEQLISLYPEFKPMYEDLYKMCRNVEKVMTMYSKELAEMDRNTVHLMIDEYQEEIEEIRKQKEQLRGEKEQLQGEKEQLQGEKEQLCGEKKQLQEDKEKLQREKEQLQDDNIKKDETIQQLQKEIELLKAELHE